MNTRTVSPTRAASARSVPASMPDARERHILDAAARYGTPGPTTQIGSSSSKRSSPRRIGACNDIMQTRNSTTTLITDQNATIGKHLARFHDAPFRDRVDDQAENRQPDQAGCGPENSARVARSLAAAALRRDLERMAERPDERFQDRRQDLEAQEGAVHLRRQRKVLTRAQQAQTPPPSASTIGTK